MCGRVIQSSAPIRNAILEGMDCATPRPQLSTALERRAYPARRIGVYAGLRSLRARTVARSHSMTRTSS